MKKKKYEPNYVQDLIRDCECWKHLYENGGSDPNWSDGSNMNLVRNRIIRLKQLIRDNPTLEELPECFYEADPPEMPRDYMTRADEIRETARKNLVIMEADEDLKFIREQMKALPSKLINRLCLKYISGYEEGLRCAIEMAFNLERYALIPCSTDCNEAGRIYELTTRVCMSMGEYETRDFAPVGKALFESNKGIETKLGLLFINEQQEFFRVLRRQDFPSILSSPLFCKRGCNVPKQNGIH